MSQPYYQPLTVQVPATTGYSLGSSAADAASGATMAAIGIAGAALAGGLALGAMCFSTAAAGAGALAEAVSEEMQKDRLMAIAGREPVELKVERLTLRARHVEAFGRALQAFNQLEKLEGGSLVLKDGSTRKLTYSVRDQSRNYLFSATPAPDGGIEIYSFGEAGRKAAWNAYMRAIAEVARTQLGADGWKPAPATSDRELFRLVRENPARRRKDQLVATYHPDKGCLLFKTDGWQDGRQLLGAECISIDQLLGDFTTRAAATPPEDKPGGAAARMHSGRAFSKEREIQR